MENHPIVKTEVMSDDEESLSKWVNTDGSCFLCLTSTVHRVVMPLRRLLRHLKIDLSQLYSDSVGNPKEWDLKVDLCKSCGATQGKLFHLLKKLEKIQADVNDLLKETDISIAKSAENQELMENFSVQLTGNEGFNFEFLDNIRKTIRKQCMQLFRQPNFDLEDDEDEALVSNVNESSEDEDSSAEGIEQILNSSESSIGEEEEAADSSDSENSSEEEEAADSSDSENSSAEGIEETLNSSASSVGEEEETSHSSDSENSSEEEEPRRSDRINKMKKEKQAAMSSEQNSKTSVASTSNCQGMEEMLNDTASSDGEEEETSHSSDSATSAEQEPRRSLRMKEKQAAVLSKESSVIASTSKNQENLKTVKGKD